MITFIKVEVSPLPDGQVKMCETIPAAPLSKHQKYFLQSLGLG